MKTLMFYSYKGGSGRTLAAANVAAALAKLGERVLILDLDFEAPGLQHVFKAEETEQFRSGYGIQNYLRGEINIEELDKELVINLFGESQLLQRYSHTVPENACFLYIMASPKVMPVTSDDPQVQSRMQGLLNHFKSKHNINFVILDSASGIRDAYTIAADVSDEMLIFFRWSSQHVEGTLRIARYMKRLKDYKQRSIPFKVIASASPSKNEIEQLNDDELRNTLMRFHEDARNRIRQTLTECEVDPADIFYDIPEILELKWRESILVFARVDSHYERLARKLQSTLKNP